MRVLISDDYQLIRDGMAVLVNRLAEKIEIIEATTNFEAIACATDTPAFALAIVGVDYTVIDAETMARVTEQVDGILWATRRPSESVKLTYRPSRGHHASQTEN